VFLFFFCEGNEDFPRGRDADLMMDTKQRSHSSSQNVGLPSSSISYQPRPNPHRDHLKNIHDEKLFGFNGKRKVDREEQYPPHMMTSFRAFYPIPTDVTFNSLVGDMRDNTPEDIAASHNTNPFINSSSHRSSSQVFDMDDGTRGGGVNRSINVNGKDGSGENNKTKSGNSKKRSLGNSVNDEEELNQEIPSATKTKRLSTGRVLE
jgi:hypothetical protein